jgi:hypothetical protein
MVHLVNFMSFPGALVFFLVVSSRRASSSPVERSAERGENALLNLFKVSCKHS